MSVKALLTDYSVARFKKLDETGPNEKGLLIEMGTIWPKPGTIKHFMKTIVLLFFYCCCIFPLAVSAQEKSIFEWLSADEPAIIQLETNLETLVANRKTESWQTAKLVAQGQNFDLKIKPRGRFRRKISDLPPVKLKFPKKTLLASGMDTLNEVRLTFPIDNSPESQSLIYREYLCYKLFETLSPMSTRARLAKVTLINLADEKAPAMTLTALLVEDKEELVSRLQADELEQFGYPIAQMDQQHYALVVMFQYMIGNTDWNQSTLHNLRLIKLKNNGQVLSIPFDFDFAGMVDAPYAVPNAETGLQSVRQRFLMDNEVDFSNLQHAVEGLHAKQASLEAICRSPAIPAKLSEQALLYLRQYFQVTSDPAFIQALRKKGAGHSGIVR